MPSQWWRDAVVYHLYPRSFMDSNGDGVGDLPGILSRLDYLQWLGVDVIWLCPIHPSPNVDNGYDVADYQGISPAFGTMADFDQLLTEVHRRGMRLILDLVLNHTSDAHPWFQDSRSSRNSPRRDWYIWRDGRDDGPPNNWESIFLGPAWTWDEGSGQYYLHLFTPGQPDLNWANPELRQAMYAMVRWWLDKGVDGFRIDAVTLLKKPDGLPDMPNPDRLAQVPAYAAYLNAEGVLDVVRDLAKATFRHYDVMTLGEANGVTANQAEAWVGEEDGPLNLIMHFEHWHLPSSEPGVRLDVVALKRIFTRWQKALAKSGWNALYLENTELPRLVSRWGDVAHFRHESATAFAACYLLQRGTPFIYQGQELGMGNTRFESLEAFDDVFSLQKIRQLREAGGNDADIFAELAENSRDNARTPMPWTAGLEGGFTTGTPWLAMNPEYPDVNVASEQENPHSTLYFYRELIHLRRQEPALLRGGYRLILPTNRQIYAYVRELEGEGILVLCNLTAKPAFYRHGSIRLRYPQLLLANQTVSAHEDTCRLKLRPFETRIYRL